MALRAVRGALPVEVRHQREPSSSRFGAERELVELGGADAEQPGHGVGDLGGVERADQGQEPAGGIGEPGDRSGGVRSGRLGDGEGRAAGAQAERQVTGAQAEAEGEGHVVAGAGSDERAAGARPLPCGVGRSEHLGQRIGPVHLGVDEVEQIGPVAALGRAPPAGARGVTPVGRPGTGEAEGQPVVGQPDPSDALEGGGLAPAHPAQLGDGEAGDRHAAARVRPPLGAELGDEGLGVVGRLGVVPQLGRSDHRAGRVEHDEAVLLSGDRDGCGRAPQR